MLILPITYYYVWCKCLFGWVINFFNWFQKPTYAHFLFDMVVCILIICMCEVCHVEEVKYVFLSVNCMCYCQCQCEGVCVCVCVCVWKYIVEYVQWLQKLAQIVQVRTSKVENNACINSNVPKNSKAAKSLVDRKQEREIIIIYIYSPFPWDFWGSMSH